MSELALNFIVLTFFVLLALAVFIFLQRKSQQKDKEFQQSVRERGWQIDRVQRPLESGYIIKGKDGGSSWVLETLAEASSQDSGPASSNITRQTKWRTDDITLSDGSIVIGPISNQADVKLIQQFGSSLLQAGLRSMLGKDSQWAADLNLLEAGSPTFQKKYLCLGNQIDAVHQLLQPEVEKLLLLAADRHKLIVSLRPTGLTINLPNEQLLDIQEVDQIITLGKVIASAWNSIKPSNNL